MTRWKRFPKMTYQTVLSMLLYIIAIGLIGCLLLVFFIRQSYAKAEYDYISYQQDSSWQKLQQTMPEAYRLSANTLPKEWFWDWKYNYKLHVDHYPNPQAKAKIILLHGVGTNGRQMSLILGQPLASKGYETLALDLPGYGLTKVPNRSDINYGQWVDVVNDFINAEAAKDDRPIFLYGLSAGGMLTLHVASVNKHVKGIIGMTFLDQQNYQVQKGTMRFSPLSRINLWGLGIAAKTPLRQIRLPMALVSKMSVLTNDKNALKIMLADPLSAGNAMSMEFLDSYMHYIPPVPVQNFSQCPVLLTQPEKDRWTPLSFSQPVLSQLKVEHQVIILPQGGHYPVEPAALDKLLTSSIEFIEKNR